MSQLGRFDYTVQTALGVAVSGASVNVYREGATVNGAQSGVSPLTVTVRHKGKIAAADTVFVNAATGTTYTVNSVTATTVVLAGFVGTLSLSGGDRLTPSNSQPTLYGDDQAGASTANPLTSSSTGRASCWMEFGTYDFVVSGGGATTTAFTSQVVPSEAPGQVRYADEFQYGSSTGGIQEAINDLPSTGGTVFLSGGVTYTIPSGTGLTITGNDVSIIGRGDSSLIDASAESGATVAITVTGKRCVLRDFKLAHGRLAGASNNAITLSTTDTAHLDGLNITNAGQFGIYTANCTDLHIVRSRITSSKKDGIFVDTGITGLWVRDCTLTTCGEGDGSGVGSIRVVGNTSGSTADSDIHITHNRIVNSRRVGIQINSSNASFPTKRVWITDNNIDTTGTGASVAGEGIAFTANEVVCARNRVDKAAVVGILAYATCTYCVISDNIISNSSQNGGATHPAIQLNANTAYGTGLISNVTLSGNVSYDDQGGPTQTGLLGIFRGTGGSFARIFFYGGVDLNGTTTDSTSGNSTLAFSNIADKPGIIDFGHTKDYVTQNVTAAGTNLTNVLPTLYLTADNSYTISATPSVNDGFDNQILRIVNVDTVDTITLQDQGTLPSSNLRLGAATRALGPRDNITLLYSATVGDWVEVAFTNVT